MSSSYITSWTVSQAKRDFALGLLKSFRLEAVPMAPGSWAVVIVGPLNTHGPLVDVRTKGPRAFKTLDAAVGSLVDIGFRVDALVKG